MLRRPSLSGFDGRSVLLKLVCLALCVGGAAAAQWAHIPLAWVLAPLLVTAAFSLAGAPTFAPQAGRRFGQVVIGSSVGLFVTLEVLHRLVGMVPIVVGTAICSILVCVLVGQVFGRVVGVDSTTAFFATTPGGLSEMARIGEQVGARVDVISLTQAVRVATVVLVLPPAVMAFGLDGTMDWQLNTLPLDIAPTLLVVAIGAMGAFLLSAIRFDNPWMIGALAAVAMLAASGLVDGRLPQPLFWAGQLMIGLTIGARFKRATVRSIPRVCLAAFPTALASLLAMTGFGLLLALLFHLDPATAILGASPGGLAEMSVTAQLLHVDVALVVAFHVVRSFMVNGFSRHIYNALVHLRVLHPPRT